MIHRSGYKNIWLCIISLSLLTTGCKFPDDPDHTLSKIENSHTIKIGICSCQQNEIQSREKSLLISLANTLHARIIWVADNQEALYRSLEAKKIDIMACNIQKDSPWNERVALSIPYEEKPVTRQKHVFALPSGENAWLKYINEFIYRGRKI
ncbi:MAG: hypothetical protein Q8M03_13330 [Legionella sp.]|nr:hypothetical protein [Legionella sp.]